VRGEPCAFGRESGGEPMTVRRVRHGSVPGTGHGIDWIVRDVQTGHFERGPGDLLAAFAGSLLSTRHGYDGSDAAQLASADRAPRRGTV
jgi:hypothetical protein